MRSHLISSVTTAATHTLFVALLSVVPSGAVTSQVTIPPDTITTIADGDTIPGFGAVGGVAVDALGYVYTANFRNAVWRYTPGESIERLADGMFGASGNAIGFHGELYQSSFHGHYITRVARDGSTSVFAKRGLNGPVGIILGADTALYVVNCSGNYVSRLDAQGNATTIAEGPLFACPNGITKDNNGDLYVVNFGNTQIIKITKGGTASVFADIPGAAGNGHITFGRGAFFVTKFRGHQIFRVERDGTWSVLAGTGKQGHTDGPAKTALLSSPNGIMMTPNGRELWVNELIAGNGVGGGPAHSVLRRITLVGLTEVLAAAAPNTAALVAAYRGYRQARPKEDTSGEAIAFAYTLLNPTRAADALQLFRMNADDFAADPTSQYQLGEGYRFTNQPELAKRQYQKVLTIDPNHALSRARLGALGG